MDEVPNCKKFSGAIKHCAFGGCNSDSRAGRPGNRPGLKFVSFPKPCLQLRKLIPQTARESVERVIKSHLKSCLICKRCEDWMKSCRRKDSRWKNLSNITKDTYICEYHFIDVDEEILPRPHPASKVNEIRAKPKRRLLPPRTPLGTSPKRKKLSKTPDFVNSAQDVVVENNTSHVETTTNTEDILSEIDISVQEILNDGNEEGSYDIHTEPSSTVLVGGSVNHQKLTRPTTRSISTRTTFTFSETKILCRKTKNLKEKLRSANTKLQEYEKLEKVKFMKVFKEKIKKNDSMCKFYTGFVYAQIVMLLNFVASTNVNYWGAERKSQKTSPHRKKFDDTGELILTLVRLRTGLPVQDLAYRFECSTGLFTKIFTTWIQLMFNKFSSLRPLMFPSRQKIQESLPQVFSNLKNIRVIIDCMEIFCQTPSNLEHQANVFSKYKTHTTFKVLIGCNPNGSVSFVSDLFESSISDREIVTRSKLLDFLEEGDLVLADRGFTIKDMTDEIAVQLNIPAFLKGRDKLTAVEEIQTKIIAKQRIYVEHVIGRIKNYRLLKKVIPLSLRGILSQVVFVCANLQNFQPPLIE